MASRARRNLVSIADLDRPAIQGLLAQAERLVECIVPPDTLHDKVVGLLFFQPSTRTRVGFQVAAQRLGASTVEVTSSKMQPGMEQPESIADTVRVVSAYCDVVVVRHERVEGLEAAARASEAPLVNGGAGREHHPTQALVDLFAIKRSLGVTEGYRLGIAGDLAGSRAARSLVDVLRMFQPAELRLMAPLGREMPAEALHGFADGVVSSADGLEPEGLDILYMAGLPEGRGEDRLDRSVRKSFSLDADTLERLPPGCVVLCPLPRVDEIHEVVDRTPQASYFRQSAEGLFVRMAVLEWAAGIDWSIEQGI